MRLVALALPLMFVTAACGYRGQQPSNDASYTTRSSQSTTVTVHPPPPEVVTQRSRNEEPVGRTETTSAELVLDRRPAPITASAQPDVSGRHPDRKMSDHIQGVLVSDPTLRGVALERVRVTAVERRIRLAGIVPTLADKVAIEQRVREVKGVEAVENEIEVLH